MLGITVKNNVKSRYDDNVEPEFLDATEDIKPRLACNPDNTPRMIAENGNPDIPSLGSQHPETPRSHPERKRRERLATIIQREIRDIHSRCVRSFRHQDRARRDTFVPSVYLLPAPSESKDAGNFSPRPAYPRRLQLNLSVSLGILLQGGSRESHGDTRLPTGGDLKIPSAISNAIASSIGFARERRFASSR